MRVSQPIWRPAHISIQTPRQTSRTIESSPFTPMGSRNRDRTSELLQASRERPPGYQPKQRLKSPRRVDARYSACRIAKRKQPPMTNRRLHSMPTHSLPPPGQAAHPAKSRSAGIHADPTVESAALLQSGPPPPADVSRPSRPGQATRDS